MLSLLEIFKLNCSDRLMIHFGQIISLMCPEATDCYRAVEFHVSFVSDEATCLMTYT